MSTLLNVICGVDNYDEGEMYFKGNETSYFSIEDIDHYRKKNVLIEIDGNDTVENIFAKIDEIIK